jgi:hypothetical protein
MAVYKKDIVAIELNSGNVHRSFLQHSLGKSDKNANHFGIRVFRGGEPVDLSDVSVQGFFKDPQGTNIAITSGNIVGGNQAEVVLPQACYNYEGQFSLAIKLVGGGVTGTMRIVDGMIDNTNTGSAVAPTGAVPTYQEVLASYDAAIAAVDDVNEMKSTMFLDLDALYKGEYKEYNASIIEGGLNTSGGNLNNSARARTTYTEIVPGDTYHVKIEGLTWSAMIAWVYSGTTQGTVIRRIDLNPDKNDFIFTAETNENYLRVAFYYSADSTHVITADERADIKSKFRIRRITDRTLTKQNAAADAKATGEAIAAEATARENTDTEIRTALDKTIDNVIVTPNEFEAQNNAPFAILENGIDTSGGDLTNSARARTKYFKVKQGERYLFFLNSSEFKYVNAYEYSNADGSAMLNRIKLVDNTHIIYTPSTGAKCFRISFAHNDSSVEVTYEDRVAIRSCLKMYTLTDKDLATANVPADSKIVGDTIQYATGCRPIKYREGYYYNLANDTVDLSAPTANVNYKCALVPCSEGDKFTINGDGQTSAQIYGFADAEGNLIKKYGAYTESITDRILTAPANSAYLILNDRGGYQSYYGEKATNLPEVNAGELEAVLENCPEIDWESISPSSVPSTTFKGWRGGYWDSTNAEHNTDNNGSIRYWTYISAKRSSIGTQYVEFTPPGGTNILLREFATKDSTEQLSIIYVTKRTVVKLNENSIYRITVYGLREKPIADYLNDDFISQIKIRPIYSYPSQKKKRTSEFIRFTVPINLGWPDTTATGTDNADPANMTDLMCILTLPKTYTPGGKKTPLIMYCHGASCRITETSWYSNGTEGEGADFLKMIRKFTAAGYAVFDVNNTRDMAGGFPDWGSLPLMSAYIKAWEYIKFNYNVEDRLFLLSASMGTPANLNMMKWYKGDIIASIINAPRAMGIKDRWTESLSDETIKKYLVSWGLEPDSILDDPTYVVPTKESVFTQAVDARFRGFYHHENLTEINGTKYIFEKFPPVKVFIGQNDSSFLDDQREYFAALQNFGNFISTREIAGIAHGSACTLAAGELREEAIAWFDRFRTVIPDDPDDQQT